MIAFVLAFRVPQIRALLNCAVSLIVLSASSGTNAQEICKHLLEGGVFDQHLIADDHAMASYLRTRFCKSDSSSGSGSLTLPLGKVPVPVGFEFNSESKSDVCSDKESSLESWDSYLSWTKTASKELLEEFGRCINSDGLRIWVERASAPDRFRLRIRYSVRADQIPPARVTFGFTPEDNVYDCGMSLEKLKDGLKLNNHDFPRYRL